MVAHILTDNTHSTRQRARHLPGRCRRRCCGRSRAAATREAKYAAPPAFPLTSGPVYNEAIPSSLGLDLSSTHLQRTSSPTFRTLPSATVSESACLLDHQKIFFASVLHPVVLSLAVAPALPPPYACHRHAPNHFCLACFPAPLHLPFVRVAVSTLTYDRADAWIHTVHAYRPDRALNGAHRTERTLPTDGSVRVPRNGLHVLARTRSRGVAGPYAHALERTDAKSGSALWSERTLCTVTRVTLRVCFVLECVLPRRVASAPHQPFPQRVD